MPIAVSISLQNVQLNKHAVVIRLHAKLTVRFRDLS